MRVELQVESELYPPFAKYAVGRLEFVFLHSLCKGVL